MVVVTGTQDPQVLDMACALGIADPSDAPPTMSMGRNFILVDRLPTGGTFDTVTVALGYYVLIERKKVERC